VYHVELRQFPHLHRQFNLSPQELRALVMPWVYGQEIEVGERKWSIHRAKLIILEGPHLDTAELAMGRGWRAAQRRSEDVSERITAAARKEIESAQAAQGMPVVPGVPANPASASAVEPPVASGAPAAGGVLSDPLALGVQIASLLGPDPTRLLEAWRAAASASPELSPSQSLALAESQLEQPDASTG
jgi:hypothetical protein